MEFCKSCDNMCYMKINKDKQLIYFCKYCGFEDTEAIETKNLKILKFSKFENSKILETFSALFQKTTC